MDVPDELVDALTLAVDTTLRELAGVEVIPRDVSRADGEGQADVTTELRLDGGTAWRLVLRLPGRTAAALADRVLAVLGGAVDEGMVRDCACELAGVVAGRARALLRGTPLDFTYSPPAVLAADGAAAGPVRVIGFGSDAGEFALHLGPPPGDVGRPDFTGQGG